MQRRFPAWLLCSVCATALTAQDYRWSIPDDYSAVLFKRSFKSSHKILAPEALATKKIDIVSRLLGKGPAASSYQSIRRNALGPKQQSFKKSAADLRDLASRVALDLSSVTGSGVRRIEVPDPGAIGSVSVMIKRDMMTSNGVQKLHCTIESRFAATSKAKSARKKLATLAAVRAKGSKGPPMLPAWRLAGVFLANGTLEITRKFDPASRKLLGFTSTTKLTVDGPEDIRAMWGVTRCSITFNDSWNFHRQSVPNDSAFQNRVSGAITEGGKYLTTVVAGKNAKNKNFHRLGPGHRALVLLTLLRSTGNPTDPVVAKALNALRKSKITRTYDLAMAIMVIESLYASPDEREMLLNGRLDRPHLRKPSDADRKLLEKWTKTLLANRDSRVDGAYLSRWNYTPGKRYDNSNTQYALLGLYAASLCGIEISPQVWHAATAHWLKDQAPAKGKTVRVKLTTHKDLLRLEKQGGQAITVSAGVPARVRGWAYVGSKTKGHTGSMTTAGISGLAICRAALQNAKKGSRKEFYEIDKAITDGFAWLDKNFTVRKNPGKANWLYYYLYGLERACELSGVALINTHNWYFEGASHLLAQQAKGGSWNKENLVDTCFAILFLKKATLPVITSSSR